MSQDRLGLATCHSGALVSKIERGERAAGLDFCRSVDTELRTGGALEKLWKASVGDPAGASAGTDAVLARLRRALGTLGVGSDTRSVRSLELIEKDVHAVTEDRLHARYRDVASAAPGLVAELADVELRVGEGRERRRAAALMVLALRAADGFAFKLGHHDLSARLVDVMSARAQTSEDPATMAAAAYVATETYFATGDLFGADRAGAGRGTDPCGATGRPLRSPFGGQGGNANVGLWVRDEESYAWLRSFLTPERVRGLLGSEAAGLDIDVFPLPNLLALNVVVHGLLGSGVASSTRPDPQAKGLGEYLRSRVVPVPEGLLTGR